MTDLLLPGLFVAVMLAFLIKPVCNPTWGKNVLPVLALTPFATSLVWSAGQCAGHNLCAPGQVANAWMLPFFTSPFAIWGLWQIMSRMKAWR